MCLESISKIHVGFKRRKARSKVAVFFIGDSVPHGAKELQHEDNGCPEQVNYQRALAALKASADKFSFVSCGGDEYMNRLQRKFIDDNNPNESFLDLGTMVNDLPELAIAAIKEVRSPKAKEAYLKRLELADGSKAGRITLMLEGPKD